MQVGDYVRTKNGIICKIVSGNEDNYNIDIPFKTIEDSEDFGEHFLEYNDNGRYFTEDIYKSSPNIINLIEVGDYVNGEKIIKIINDFVGRPILVYGFDDGKHQIANAIYEEDIKTIVTKEQFESMEYKAG